MVRTCVVKTDLANERDAQALWRPRTDSGFADMAVFDRLVKNEFRDPDDQVARQSASLSRVVSHAAQHVPYYADLMAERGLRAADIAHPDDLPRLPLLNKQIVRDEERRLRPPELPRGERYYGVFTSSGTTGQPARILHTVRNNEMFTLLTQRAYRWFRLDPMSTLAFIRLASQLPRVGGRRTNPDGATLRWQRWRYVGTVFETGPWLGYNVTNPVEEQLAWLARESPRYLASYSETLEHLCLAAGGVSPAASIEATLALSEQLTPGMRRRIEQTFAAPVHQNYGLNEIGLVACRCAAGRYHVHTEHCLVEIVDDEGQPVPPGARGRIAVTALNNPAMPLIRYDTDDWAEAARGPCPCGRTLPSFADILGRYSRIAYLPEGTLGAVGAVREALERMPANLARALRKFQMHQGRDNHFTLRLKVAAPLPEAFRKRVRAAWISAAPADWPLEIIEVEDLPLGPGGKFQDFTSDHMPGPDGAQTRKR